ncbi:protein-glutamine glutaminase family protein [Maribacter sp. MAR_2009_72]|uniref:protein-glutamine glutaminase family protein n=1 Tax=Maribacter sp. MAR_2009_72 TaxID=1250050 RepID=UPI00119C7EB0|nr:protein-glutamine glutaminase family protein [Maribacter sp. MAR_2009_72]TVZ14338.1 hypothetical protein JM81_0541 [Maribacter sp. MAR_2009_72]
MKEISYLTILFFLVIQTSNAQTYFEVEKDFNCKCGTFTKTLSELKIYLEEEINEVFNHIIVYSGMTFSYPQGGCQQRAQMMHRILEKKEIQHSKIWLFAPIILDHSDKRQLEINDPNDLVPDDKIYWGYHVAPSVLTKSSTGIVDTLVIDPSISLEKPLKLKEWFSKINNSTISKFTFLDSKYYFFNTQPKSDGTGNTTVINGFFYPYKDVENMTDTFDNAVVERELAVNDVAVFLLQRLEGGYEDSDGQIKLLLGNVEDMIGLFAPQQRFNSFQVTNMRNLLETHGPLIDEAMDFYHGRVLHWLKVK